MQLLKKQLMKIIRRIFDTKGAPALAIMFAVLFIAEGRRQLRKRNQARGKRVVTNSLLAIPSFTLLRFLFLPVMVKLAKRNQQWRMGLNHQYISAPALKMLVAFLMMDYTNYLWHIANHKLPVFWRFHIVHHCDPDLDVTTAFRFHFGEMIGSVFFRGFFVLLAGVTAMQVLLYEILFEGATQFHHSNWKLPYRLEKALNKVIVTPRMHGIHHSIIKAETDSNYAVIFSFWDRLHNTIRLNIPQDLVVIGVPSYSNSDELTAGYLLKLPFTKIRSWGAGNEIRDASSFLPYKNDLAK